MPICAKIPSPVEDSDPRQKYNLDSWFKMTSGPRRTVKKAPTAQPITDKYKGTSVLHFTAVMNHFDTS